MAYMEWLWQNLKQINMKDADKMEKYPKVQVNVEPLETKAKGNLLNSAQHNTNQDNKKTFI